MNSCFNCDVKNVFVLSCLRFKLAISASDDCIELWFNRGLYSPQKVLQLLLLVLVFMIFFAVNYHVPVFKILVIKFFKLFSMS